MQQLASILTAQKAEQSTLGRGRHTARTRERGKGSQPCELDPELLHQRQANAQNCVSEVQALGNGRERRPRIGIGVMQIEHVEAPEPASRGENRALGVRRSRHS
jgi:hypothetical protein